MEILILAMWTALLVLMIVLGDICQLIIANLWQVFLPYGGGRAFDVDRLSLLAVIVLVS